MIALVVFGGIALVCIVYANYDDAKQKAKLRALLGDKMTW